MNSHHHWKSSWLLWILKINSILVYDSSTEFSIQFTIFYFFIDIFLHIHQTIQSNGIPSLSVSAIYLDSINPTRSRRIVNYKFVTRHRKNKKKPSHSPFDDEFFNTPDNKKLFITIWVFFFFPFHKSFSQHTQSFILIMFHSPPLTSLMPFCKCNASTEPNETCKLLFIFLSLYLSFIPNRMSDDDDVKHVQNIETTSLTCSCITPLT